MNPTTRNLLYSLSLLPGILVVYGNLHSGTWYAAANLIFSLIVLGMIDWMSKPLLSDQHSGEHDTTPNLILGLHVPLQIACIASFVFAARNHIHADGDLFLCALSMGVYSGSGAIVVAHEFIHRKAKAAQWAGKFLLFTAGNFYFFIEHLRVHHKWVGTEKDSASAKRGQSLYGFFVSSGLGQIQSAWKLEKERLEKIGKSVFSWNNYMVRQFVYHFLFDTCMVLLAGWIALAAWFVQCILANFLLEYVNYIEHYGLSRSENERVTELHSWQSDLFVSRFFLVDLSRHADHHYYASKPFHTLQSYPKSPVLPAGYPSLILPALIPPLWRKIIHPILDRR
ncbi:MAG: alkane 1-monooxygenase [Bacteroidia bacterium]|jgi:alkane 1-monooxygenase|nr:alkane 1-monooxygenase [Bacteroidia bacterium]